MNKYLPSILAVSLLAGSAATVAPVNAQTVAPTTNTAPSHAGRKPFDRATMLQDMKTKLDAEVASGKITVAQETQMLSRMQNMPKPGTMPKGGARGAWGKGGGTTMPAGMLQNQADLLGISVTDLQSRLSQGKTFQQIATDLGITQAQLNAKRADQMKTHLQELVTSGKITQTQADSLLQKMQNPPKFTPGQGMGRRGSFMKHPTNAPSSATTS